MIRNVNLEAVAAAAPMPAIKTLGIHALVWTAASSEKELEAAMIASAELGYQLIEFPNLDPARFNVQWLARRLHELGLQVAVTLGLPPDCDISSEDATTVKRGEALLGDAVRLTRDLGGKKLGGILFSAHTKYQTMPTARGWANSVKTLSRVANRAKSAGVSINIEIANRFETNLLNTVEQGLRFIKESGSDNIFLHLDTFHMAIEECAPAAAVRLAGSKLGYLHIGENYRGEPGTGTINFSAIFDALLDIGYEDAITIESFSRTVVERELALRCAIWRDTWAAPRELARRARAFIEFEFAQAVRRRRAMHGLFNL